MDEGSETGPIMDEEKEGVPAAEELVRSDTGVAVTNEGVPGDGPTPTPREMEIPADGTAPSEDEVTAGRIIVSVPSGEEVVGKENPGVANGSVSNGDCNAEEVNLIDPAVVVVKLSKSDVAGEVALPSIDDS